MTRHLVDGKRTKTGDLRSEGKRIETVMALELEEEGLSSFGHHSTENVLTLPINRLRALARKDEIIL